MTVTVTLSDRIARIVQSHVDNGTFADTQSVVEAAIADLEDRQSEIDTWMIDAVLPTLSLNRAEPCRTLSHDETFEQLRHHIKSVNKARAA